MVICLEQGADCLHIVKLMPLHRKTRAVELGFENLVFKVFKKQNLKSPICVFYIYCVI